jgi:hypothetical protein
MINYKHFFTIIIFTFLSLLNNDRITAQSIEYNPKIKSLVDSVSIGNLQNHIEQLCWAGGYQTRSTHTLGNYAAAEYIATYFESLPGITEVVRDTFYIYSSTPPYHVSPVINIVAYLQGSDSEITLIGAHYDASGSRDSATDYDENWQTMKIQGADDNATGVAAIMEIARILSDAANNLGNKKTIKFIAFAAEEYHPTNPGVHHAGSLWDADKMYDNKENLTSVIVLDMFGYNPLKDYVEVISNNPSLWLADIIYENKDHYVPSLETNTFPADVPYSDHESYQKFGFPAILLMENDRPWNDDSPNYLKNPYYHTEADTIGTLNFSLIHNVTKTALSNVAYLSIGELSAIEENSGEILPITFKAKAFPNPFNAQTQIQFELFKPQQLSISLYNLLGQEIVSLETDTRFNSGQHTIKWDAHNFSSGIYICRISGEDINYGFKLNLIK